MRAGEKFWVDYLKFDYSKKRAFAAISSIEHSVVTLRMPSVLAELAEEDCLVCGCLFQFRCFFKNKYDLVLAELAEEDCLVCGCLFQFRCFFKNKYD